MDLEQVEEQDGGEGLHIFLVREDPGPYPLRFELELNTPEVYFGLLHGGFYPGTVLLDQADGRRYVVRASQKQLILEPACVRVWLYAYHHNYISREELQEYLLADQA